MSSLITADIHLTANPRDSYRLGLLPWMLEQVRKNKIDVALILGDLTDSKDRHPSKLVNTLVHQLDALSRICRVIVLKGNHDYIEPEHPFFGFVSLLRHVTFLSQPCELALSITGASDNCLFLPSTEDWERDWTPYAKKLKTYDFVFCHQTFKGAARENGTVFDAGIPPTFFKGTKGKVYSGDIHVPQRFANSYGPEYVGAPYRIDFGDSFTPRVLMLGPKGAKDLRFPCTNKHLVTLTNCTSADFGALGDVLLTQEIKPGDQVKVRAILKRSDFPLWPKLKKSIVKLAETRQWQLFGPELRANPEEKDTHQRPIAASSMRYSPEEVLRAFAEEDLGDEFEYNEELVSVGTALLKSVQT